MQEDSTQPTPDSPWQFNAEANPPAAPSTPVPDLPEVNLSWTASEFISHEKSASWYVVLGIAAILVAGIMYTVTRDRIIVGVILLVTVLFGVMSVRKPRTLNYKLDSQGIHIGEKTYGFADFKSFAVIDEGAFNSILLMPLKRFMPPLSVYYPPDEEHKIVDTIGSYLPHEERQHDAIDRLMRKVRF